MLHFTVSASKIPVKANERVPERPNESLEIRRKKFQSEKWKIYWHLLDFNM